MKKKKFKSLIVVILALVILLGSILPVFAKSNDEPIEIQLNNAYKTSEDKSFNLSLPT